MSSKEGSYLPMVLPPLLLRIRKGSFLARLDVPAGLSRAGGEGSWPYSYCPFVPWDLQHWAALVEKEEDCYLLSS